MIVIAKFDFIIITFVFDIIRFFRWKFKTSGKNDLMSATSCPCLCISDLEDNARYDVIGI